MIVVRLNKDELQHAAKVGSQRYINSLFRGSKDWTAPAGTEREYWQSHIEGASAEYAFALWLGVQWEATIDTYKRRRDVAGMEVRVNSRTDGDLFLREDDQDDDAVFYLLTGLAPEYIIRGWAFARQVKCPEFRKRFYNGRPPAWVYPQHLLNPPTKGKHSLFL